MGVLEYAVMHPGKTLQMLAFQQIALSEQELSRNFVQRAGLKVQMTLIPVAYVKKR